MTIKSRLASVSAGGWDGEMHTAVETGGAWLIGIILLMVGIQSAIFPENEDDKFGHKNWHLDELMKR